MRENGAPEDAGIRRSLRSPLSLLICALCWTAVLTGLSISLTALLNRLYALWGLTEANAHLAPGWARLLIDCDESVISILASLAAGLVTLKAAGRLLPLREERGRDFRGRPYWMGSIALAAVLMLICGCTDTIRMAVPFDMPHLTARHVFVFLSIPASAFAREVLLRRVLYAPAADRGRRLAAIAISALAALLLELPGGLSTRLAVLPMLGICACGVYDRTGLKGAWALQCAWSLVVSFLFSLFGAPGDSVYPVYIVSEPWLPGCVGALLWLIPGIVLYRKSLRGRLARIRGQRGASGIKDAPR